MASNVFCTGNLLKTVQTLKIYDDSKTFVDMPLKYPPDEVLTKFELIYKRGDFTKSEIEKFLEENFLPAGKELLPAELPDWQESPDMLKTIKDKNLKDWAADLNSIWKKLARKVDKKVESEQDHHTLIYVPHIFVVPGDRFREYYYWDTYWSIKGMLSCGMTQTTKSILENFIYMFRKYGLIPNGGRLYYVERSQPPMFAPMMHQYLLATSDLDFIKNNLDVLEAEYEFWMKNRSVQVKHKDKNYIVNRYHTVIDEPRPEGYFQDYPLVKDLNKAEATKLLTSIASAAESGMDFSSRWFSQSPYDGPVGDITSIQTIHIAPVDLNTFLGVNELIIAGFFKRLGNKAKEEYYSAAAQRRLDMLNDLFWHPEQKIWFDFDLETSQLRTNFNPTNVFPCLMYTYLTDQSSEGLEKLNNVMNYLKQEGVLNYPGGIPSTKHNTGQQWDFPNVWPPVMSLVIELLDGQQSVDGHQMALDMAEKWIKSNYEGWKKHSQMYEKYDAREFGKPGGGGEYEIQAGFGWTNGVILELLKIYGAQL